LAALDHLVRLSELATLVQQLRNDGCVIAFTSGTYDGGIHHGHLRYMANAKAAANSEKAALIVAIDSDTETRKRKPGRPFYTERDRAEILLGLRCVDYVVIISSREEWHQAVEFIRPDVITISARNDYPPEQLAELRRHCGEINMIPSQAQTSTTDMATRLRQEAVAEMLEQIATLDGGEAFTTALKAKLGGRP
jgi:cytidyltransferase-like protein